MGARGGALNDRSDDLRLCQEGDERAWRRLVDRYAGLVYAVARAHHLPPDACDDVAQTAFTALAANIGRIEHEAALGPWLRTTATREAWRAARRRTREKPAETPDPHPDPPSEDRLERLETHHRLRAALEDLGGRCRDLLTALYLTPTPTSYEQIADALKMPVGSIGPTRQRCLAKLADLFAHPPSASARK